jgi:omega-3 fatty acid desaturase (delta-15 desaturase)
MVAFEKSEYSRVQKQLRFRPSLLPTLAVILLDVGLLCAVRNLLDRGWVGYITSQLIIAVLCFHSFAILHECGHGSATRWRWLNVLLGHCASVLCFIPFYSWKYIHLKHHTWAGHLENDPVLKSLRSFRDRGTPVLARAGWRSWVPVGALLQHVVYLSYPLQMRRAGELTPSRLIRCLASMLWMITCYVILWRLMPGLAAPHNWAPGLGLYLVAEELVNLPHHVGMPTSKVKLPAWDQHRVSRSCYYPAGLSELFVLNFNFHIEHHLFPSLPWYRLRAARELVKPALDDGYNQALGVEWNVRNRRRGLDEIVMAYRQVLDSQRPLRGTIK